jgi:sporulation protein YlmC with PRC-barrel domain
MRSKDLIGHRAFDRTGRALGRVADLVVSSADGGAPRLVAVVVRPDRWGRLLGYERPEAAGPWPLEIFARRLRRRSRHLPWTEVTIEA